MSVRHALIVLFGGCTVWVPAPPAGSADLVIRNVTVVSPERAVALEHAYVRLEGGRITAVGTQVLKGNKEIDGSGRYLIPGLIDTHAHIDEIPGMTTSQLAEHPDLHALALRQIPRSYLYFGYTTVLSLGANGAPARWNALEDRPDAFFCGKTPVVAGYSFTSFETDSYFLFTPEQQSQLPASINAAEHTPEAVVSRMARDGAICVKTYYEKGFGAVRNLPVPTLAMIQSLVAAAHRLALPVFMHANSKQAQAFALEAGVDVLAHGMWNGHEPQNGELAPDVRALVDKIIERGVGYQPTARVIRGLADLHDPGFLLNPALSRVYSAALIEWYRSDEGAWFAKLDEPYGVTGYRRAAESSDLVLRTLAQRNARLLFGTDTPSAPIYTNPPGLNGFWEMKHWSAAGVSLRQLLTAATIGNAAAMRLAREIGTVEKGKRAHLLLLRANPLDTVDAYDAIETVFLAGRPIRRADLSAAGS
jgi:imidazolonepropionase-like amidohydrolase